MSVEVRPIRVVFLNIKEVTFDSVKWPDSRLLESLNFAKYDLGKRKG